MSILVFLWQIYINKYKKKSDAAFTACLKKNI
jgi:hypothetical protein